MWKVCKRAPLFLVLAEGEDCVECSRLPNASNCQHATVRCESGSLESSRQFIVFVHAGDESAVRHMLHCCLSERVSGASHGAVLLDPMGRTALHAAAHKGHSGVADAVLACRAEVDARDLAGQTPLHCAAQRGHVAVASLLLQARADAAARDVRARSALHAAALWGHVQVMHRVAQCDVDDVFPSLQRSRFWMWSQAEPSQCSTSLFEVRDHGGHTALHLAAQHGRLDAVKWLLHHGAEASTSDARGMSALQAAKLASHARRPANAVESAVVDMLTKKASGVKETHKSSRRKGGAAGSVVARLGRVASGTFGAATCREGGQRSTGGSAEGKPAAETSYYMMPQGTCCCPSAGNISSITACARAFDALGLARPNTWHDAYSGLPGGCSYRPSDQTLHFNLEEPGAPRSDMVPICRQAAPAGGVPGRGSDIDRQMDNTFAARFKRLLWASPVAAAGHGGNTRQPPWIIRMLYPEGTFQAKDRNKPSTET